MNCLKCPNYWKTDIDETKCDQCAEGKTIVDLLVEMPPLIMDKEFLREGYHLK